MLCPRPHCPSNRLLPGVDVGSLLGESERQQLYRTEVVARLTDGTGDFSAQRMLEARRGWAGAGRLDCTPPLLLPHSPALPLCAA